MDIFDRRVAIECWDHGLPEERVTTARLIEIARALDVPWVVTNDVHYARARDRIVHDVLSCAAARQDARPDGDAPPAQRRVVPQERRRRSRGGGARTSTACAPRSPSPSGARSGSTSSSPTLPAFPLPPGVSRRRVSRAARRAGCARALGRAWHVAAHRGAAREADRARARRSSPSSGSRATSSSSGTSCASRGARGSSARGAARPPTPPSATASASPPSIPIRLQLLFERFLSEERTEAPDIDIDFAHRERERVIQYVYERYGREHAAMVCEQITYRGQSAVRDAARVLGFCVEQADSLALLSDRFSAKATAEALRATPADDAGATARWRARSAARWCAAPRRPTGRAPRRRGRSRCRGRRRRRPADAQRGVRAVRQPERAERGTRDLARIPEALTQLPRALTSRSEAHGRIRTPATSTPSVATRRRRCATPWRERRRASGARPERQARARARRDRRRAAPAAAAPLHPRRRVRPHGRTAAHRRARSSPRACRAAP